VKTRIVHVISGLLTGGAESMLYKLLRHMNGARFEHVVVSLADGDWPMTARIESLGVPVLRCGMRVGLPDPVSAAKALRLIRGLGPDLLQGWMYHGNLAALAAAKLSAPVPVVWNICATISTLRKAKLSTAVAIWLGARLSRWPGRIISDSKASARIHQDELKFCATRWEVIPNGFDTEQFQPCGQARAAVRAELSLPGDALLFGLIGRYHPVKDHAGFLEAAALLRRREPRAHFLLAGRGVGDNPVLAGQARELGLAGAVQFMAETMDVPRLASALDIAVSSSYSESLPTVIGEAMSCGVPCVVTDVGDSAWLVGDTGMVAPTRNPAALADACAQLAAAGAERRRALGQAARQRIIQEFSLDAFAARYERVYREELEHKERTRHAA
jgi:glycosyltransferase involved in cell wall biosynthesis